MEGSAEEVHPAAQPQALAGLVELLDQVGLRAQGQHLEVAGLAGSPSWAGPKEILPSRVRIF